MPLEAVLIHRVIARMNIGGPAMHVVHLTKGLSTGYFKTRLIAGEVEDTEGDMRYYAEERGVEIVHVRQMARSLRPWQDFRTLLTLYRMFRREKPWIVHTHTAKAGAVGRLAAWFACRHLSRCVWASGVWTGPNTSASNSTTSALASNSQVRGPLRCSFSTGQMSLDRCGAGR